MKRASNPHKGVSMPFVWSVARYCLELPGGAVRHFPAGTYNEQVSTWIGRQELDLMNLAHNAWWMFKHTKMSDWGDSERRFAQWMMPEKPQPTRKWESIVELAFALSRWAWRVLHG